VWKLKNLKKLGYRYMMEIIGLLAATLTTACWLPQALKTIRSKDTSGISLVTQVMFTVGVFLWLIYGIHLGNWPLMVANAVTFVLVSVILVLKLKHG
jgi:MtN3 and saliva related transmembrane protein